MPAVAIRPRNILFIKLAEQGSTVLAAAAIQRAVDMVGRENVFLAVFAENRFILDRRARFSPGARQRWAHLARDPPPALRCGHRSRVLRPLFGGVHLPLGRAASGGFPDFLRGRPVPGRSADASPALQSVPAHESDFCPDGNGVDRQPGAVADLRRPAAGDGNRRLVVRTPAERSGRGARVVARGNRWPQRDGPADPAQRQRVRFAAAAPVGAGTLCRPCAAVAGRVPGGLRADDGRARGSAGRGPAGGGNRLAPLLVSGGQDDLAPTGSTRWRICL